MAERASPSQDDAEQGYISGSSESSIDTELEPTVTAQAFQETFAMNEQGVKELLSLYISLPLQLEELSLSKMSSATHVLR